MTICRAGINGVLVVKALADRVSFDDLKAHCEERCNETAWWVDCRFDLEARRSLYQRIPRSQNGVGPVELELRAEEKETPIGKQSERTIGRIGGS